MTQNKARKKAARALAAQTGDSYTRARRQVSTDEPAHHLFVATKWNPDRCAVTGCRQDRPAPVHRVGGLVPPQGWWSRHPAMLSTYRDGDSDRRVVEVLDAATGARIASTSVPWQPADELVAVYEAAGLLKYPGSPSHQKMVTKVGLGRPDLVGHQLGYEGTSEWWEWPDGSWRTPAKPLGRRHLVTAAPLGPHTRDLAAITVREYPGGQVVVDELVDPVDPEDTRALNAALDRLGYTVAAGGWIDLPGGIRYAPALPGHLAERDWWTLARVRIVRETTVGAVDPRVDRTFRVGEELVMNQSGRAGDEVLRDCWWSSTDIDGAHIIDADCAEVIEVLEDIPPTWAAAALTAEQITDLLAPHHPGAAEAATAWIAAGLHVSHTHGGLSIRTPAPEYREIGHVPRDYWNDNRFTKPYEAVVDPKRSWLNRKLDALPLDPVAAAHQQMVVTVTPVEITHPQGFGGHEFEYQQINDLFCCVRCGGYEIALRDRSTGEISPCPQAAKASHQTM